MLTVGVDISKRFHIVHMRKHKEQGSTFRITNDRQGFSRLMDNLQSYAKEEVLIGMESTGHYWYHLGNHLQRNGYRLKLINGYHVKQYKEIEDNTPNRNDYKDARIISKLLSDGKGLHANIYEGCQYSRLKKLFDNRKRLVEDLKRHKTLIRLLIERHFPEYERMFKSGIYIKSSLVLLEKYGLSGIGRVSASVLERLLQKVSKKRLGVGFGKRIKQAYIDSIGLKSDLELSDIELKHRIKVYKMTLQEIESLKSLMLKYLEETEEWEYLQTIPGVGVVFASGLLAELGDIRRYRRSKALPKMAGLNLTSESSGRKEGRCKISRRGRSTLRSIAYMIALNLLCHDENVKTFYKRKKDEGKASVSILTKIADKALRVSRHLILNREVYDTNKIFK